MGINSGGMGGSGAPFARRAMEITPGAVILLALLAAAFAAVIIVNARSRMTARRRELTVTVRVADRSPSGPGGMTERVVFEMVDGERVELEVDVMQSSLLSVGDRGKLTYRGKQFVDFTRENSGI